MNNTNIERRILLQEYLEIFHPAVGSELQVEQLKKFIREYESTKTNNPFPFMTVYDDLDKVVSDGISKGFFKTDYKKIFIARDVIAHPLAFEEHLHPIYKSKKKAPVRKVTVKTVTSTRGTKKTLKPSNAGDATTDLTEGVTHENNSNKTKEKESSTKHPEK